MSHKGLKPEVVLNAMGLPVPDEDRNVGFKEVCETTGISRYTIYILLEKFEFPAQRYLTSRNPVWWKSEIDLWLKLGHQGWYDRYGITLQRKDERLKSVA